MRPCARQVRIDAVAQLLRCQIETGLFSPGYPMPTVSSMSATLGVPWHTVAAAVAELVAMGYVVKRPYYELRVRPRCHWQPPDRTVRCAHPPT